MGPFVTERARRRAPVALSYAATAGAALLVAPSGEVVMRAGDPVSDSDRYVRIARSRGAAQKELAFAAHTTCVYTAPIGSGRFVCTFSFVPVAPAILRERLVRASRVLALALRDREATRDPPTGAAALAARVSFSFM